MYRKIALILSVAVFCLAAVFCFFARSGNANSSKRAIDTLEILLALSEISLQNGDLILRHGSGIWSNFIREKNLSDGRFSHIGILIEENGNFFVVHADCDVAGSGVATREALKDFLANARRVGVFRLKKNCADSVASTAETFVGLPFDRNFNLADASELYCSELVWRAMKRVLPDFVPKTFELCGCKIIPVDALVPAEYAVELFDSGAK